MILPVAFSQWFLILVCFVLLCVSCSPCFEIYPHKRPVFGLYSFLWPNNTPVYGAAIGFSLPSHQLIGIWTVSICLLSIIILLGAFARSFCLGNFHMHINLGMEPIVHVVVLFHKILFAKLFPKMNAHFTFLPSQHNDSNFSNFYQHVFTVRLMDHSHPRVYQA